MGVDVLHLSAAFEARRARDGVRIGTSTLGRLLGSRQALRQRHDRGVRQPSPRTGYDLRRPETLARATWRRPRMAEMRSDEPPRWKRHRSRRPDLGLRCLRPTRSKPLGFRPRGQQYGPRQRVRRVVLHARGTLLRREELRRQVGEYLHRPISQAALQPTEPSHHHRPGRARACSHLLPWPREVGHGSCPALYARVDS